MDARSDVAGPAAGGHVDAAGGRGGLPVETRDLGFRYPSRLAPALADVDLTVRPGETLLLLGPSGSGKSTLTLCLDGLIPHVVEGELKGTVSVAGLDTRDRPVHVLAQEVGLVFQDPEAQFCTLTVVDEVAFGLENLLAPPSQIDELVAVSLRRVGLAGFEARRLDTLSGGEKQRVALAAVMALGPGVLVLDEPSANLDPAGTEELFDRLHVVSGGAAGPSPALVIIEHRIDEVAPLVDTVLVLGAGGSPLVRGEPGAVFYEWADELRAAGVWRPRVVEVVEGLRAAGWAVPGRPVTEAAAAAALASVPGLVERLRAAGALSAGASAARAPRAVVEPPLVPDDPGRSVPVSPAQRTSIAVVPTHVAAAPGLEAAAPGAPLLRAEDLSFAYPGGAPALEGIDLALRAGEFLAVVGANGAGKSTLASLLAGLLTPPKGTVFLEDADLSTLPRAFVGRRIGFVFQNPEHQFVTERVRDELAVSLTGRVGRRIGPEDQAAVHRWLERFGLATLAEANPFTLSQGQKRRLSVAVVLARGQEVLILDEPTFGQDRAQTEVLVDLLDDLWRGGRTVVLLTHDMDLVARSARSLLVLDRGRRLFLGETRSFFARPEMVRQSRLAVPPVGRLAAGLGAPGLLTVADVLTAAGAGPAVEVGGAGGTTWTRVE